MFIEKLTKEDYARFADAFNCSLTEVKPNSNNVYVQIFNGSYGPQPEFWLSDFDCKTSAYYSFCANEIQDLYIGFMLDKFGENYSEAFNAHLDAQKIGSAKQQSTNSQKSFE